MSASTKTPRARVRLESLEDRFAPTVKVLGGALVVTGTPQADTITITRAGNSLFVAENGKVTRVAASAVRKNAAVVRSHGGNDTIDASSANLSLKAFGGVGNDTIQGGSKNDFLCGDWGSDTLFGNGGNDTLEAGLDFNLFYPRPGGSATAPTNLLIDKLFGGDGDDFMMGGTGNDEMRGGQGNDVMGGFGGDNLMYGDEGNDYLMGFDGNDMLFGGAGDDQLLGNGGADTLDGGDGNDKLQGGPGVAVLVNGEINFQEGDPALQLMLR